MVPRLHFGQNQNTNVKIHSWPDETLALDHDQDSNLLILITGHSVGQSLWFTNDVTQCKMELTTNITRNQ